MLLYIFLVFSLFNWFQNSKGNQLYQDEQYTEAMKAYREAQERDPAASAIHYNIGNALYRQDKFEEATKEYSQAIDGAEPLNARAYYNLGNSLYRTGRLQDAIEAYKRALRITPDDVDAKYNLEFAQRQLQEQEQQQQGQQDENQDKQQDESQEQQQQGQQDESESDQPEESQSPQQEQQQDNQAQDMNQDPPPRPGDMTREEAERLLNALNQDEMDLQKQLRKQSPVKQTQPKKDW